MGLKLFDESDNGDDISKIEINQEFARRFEHNKKREDLQRYEELKKKGFVSDSDESSELSDEDDEVLNDEKSDLQFYDTLVRVKRNDPIISQKDVKFFSSEEEDTSSEQESNALKKKKKKQKEKPLYLKDVMAKQLIEEGPDLGEMESKGHIKSYSAEQEEYREAFLNAAEEAFRDSEDDFLSEKKHNEVNTEVDDDEIQRKLNEYFGEDENLSENEIFLKQYFLNRRWLNKNDDSKPTAEELAEISEEEEELDEADRYEGQYNFRFQEAVEDRVLGHARFTEGSVRKKSDVRKMQRQRKEERVSKKQTELQQELKYLKNLKMQEISGKLDKVRAVAGIKDEEPCALNEDDLEEDFDPEAYDRKMKEMFNADYYIAEDADPTFARADNDDDDIGIPDFSKEDELLGLPEGWDDYVTSNGFLSARENFLGSKSEATDANILIENVKQEAGRRKRKCRVALKDKVAIEKDLEEYYKLDYEDCIGDLKTRFKYASVTSNRYGLTPSELLIMDDTDLNQYVSLKKLAPYRQNEYKVPKLKRFHMKKTTRLLLHGMKLKTHKASKMRSQKPNIKQTEKVQVQEMSGERQQSKQSRRRRRHAELKLSYSRRMAYGMLPFVRDSKKRQYF